MNSGFASIESRKTSQTYLKSATWISLVFGSRKNAGSLIDLGPGPGPSPCGPRASSYRPGRRALIPNVPTPPDPGRLGVMAAEPVGGLVQTAFPLRARRPQRIE